MGIDFHALRDVARTVRGLTSDAIERAQSGHPGLPLGVAELGSLLFGEVMRHNPADPNWVDRDRFVLSAGHGSMLLYSLLYLSGYGLTVEDIKSFRRLGSKTPGHPERGTTAGVEATTGQLGQGFSNAVGLAIAERKLAAEFNVDGLEIIHHYTFVLASDGDLMEGVSSEAASLAGSLGLGKLIVFYDRNRISIDGRTELTFTEDVGMRFRSYHWQVLEADAYDFDSILASVDAAKANGSQPTLIIVDSVIGKGAPSLQGTHTVHGGPLGGEEVRRLKLDLQIPENESFYVVPGVAAYFDRKRLDWQREYEDWKVTFSQWNAKHPDLLREFEDWYSASANFELHDLHAESYEVGNRVPTRIASGRIVEKLMRKYGWFIGGSGDLTTPCLGPIEIPEALTSQSFKGNYLYYGVREHAMGAITNGILLHGGLRAFCATFLVFSDYMRPAIRLASLMKLPAIYIFTHDSVLIGEDGPTHQPVEQLSTLRAVPGITVVRPGDAVETDLGWEIALSRRNGPTAIVLTRQDVPVYKKEDPDWRRDAKRGAYVVRHAGDSPDLVIVASGSEVSLAVDAAEQLSDVHIRVVSMISQEVYLEQDQAYRNRMIPGDLPALFVEVGVSWGWAKLLTPRDSVVSIDTFGRSGKGGEVGRSFGFDASTIVQKIKQRISEK